MELINLYQSSVMAIGALAVLMFVQLLAADFIGIKNKHIPGASVPTDHNNMLFRATRTVANTNESIGLFVVIFSFAVLSLGSPHWVAYSTWGFVASRAAYCVCYYSDQRLLRSICFGVSLLALLTLLGTGISAWING